MTEVTESDVKKFKELIETVRLLNNGEDYALHVSLAAIVNEYIINQTTDQLKQLCEAKGLSVVEWIEFDVLDEATWPTSMWNINQDGVMCYYSRSCKDWEDDNNEIVNVTHWCELPQLKESKP